MRGNMFVLFAVLLLGEAIGALCFSTEYIKYIIRIKWNKGINAFKFMYLYYLY